MKVTEAITPPSERAFFWPRKVENGDLEAERKTGSYGGADIPGNRALQTIKTRTARNPESCLSARKGI